MENQTRRGGLAQEGIGRQGLGGVEVEIRVGSLEQEGRGARG